MENRPDSRPLILHLVYRFSAGGLENGLVNIINNLPDKMFRHAIVCLTQHDAFIERIKTDIQVYDLYKKPGNDFSIYWKVWRLCRRLKPTIVHTRNLASLEMQLFAWIAGCQLRCHGEHGWDIADLYGGERKYRYFRRFLSPLISAYVALSKHTALYLTQGAGIPKNKLNHIYNGVDTHKFRPQVKRPHLAPVFSDQNCFVIGTVGRLAKVKNQQLLIRAFASLLDNPATYSKKLRLVIVGDGECKDELRELVDRKNLQQFVYFAGNQDQVQSWLNNFDLFVLPSLAEGVCNTILEAMACSTAVVATNVGGNGELVVTGETGMLVQSNHREQMELAMLHYILRPQLLSLHGESGRKRVERFFSLENMVSGYLAFYQKLLASKGVS